MEFPEGWTLGLILVICALVYLKVRESYKFFANRGIPFVKPKFLLGSDISCLFHQEHFSETWMDIYNKLKGYKLGGFFYLLLPIYMIRDPDYIKNIFISDFSHFHDRINVTADVEVNPLEANLVCLSGQKWKYLRNKLSPIFTSGKLKWMFEEMSKCGDALMEHFETLEQGKDIDCKEDLARFATDVIGSCAFGFDTQSLKDPNSKFRQMGRKIFEPSIRGGIINLLKSTFPSILKKFKIRTLNFEVHDFFISTIKQAFDHRIKTNSQRKDIVHFLLQLRLKGSVEIENEEVNDLKAPEKIEITDELLAAQSFVFFVAGFETASTTMNFTLYLLSKNQNVQNKLRKEIKSVKQQFGGFTYESLNEMEYLEKCISKTLRLYPPFPNLVRTCTKDYTFPDGTIIKKGDFLTIPVYALHRDSKYFSEPNSYIPERFDNPQHPWVYLPFGEGPRLCIGETWMDIYNKLKGHKLGGFFYLLLPIYMIRDPDYIKNIFISDFSHFHDRINVTADVEVNPLEANLVCLRGQKWKYLRNKLSPIFTSGKLKWMFEEMSKCGDALMEHFETLEQGKDIDCKEDLARFATDVIGSCAFGFDTQSLKDPNSKFRQMGRKIFEPSIRGGIINLLKSTFPSILKKFKVNS